MSDATTPAAVPLSDLLDLAHRRDGERQAQRQYFDVRKRSPHVSADREYQEARRAERRVDALVEDALNRDRRTLPGMEGGAGD